MWMKNQLYRQDVATCIEHAVGLHNLQQQKIMVVGASGTLGSFLVDALSQANKLDGMGIKIQAVGRNVNRLRKRFSEGEKDGAVELVEQDVLQSVLRADECDIIVHLASNAYPKVMYEDPVGTIRANTEGTYHLLEHLRRNHGRRMVYVSTGEIYGQVEAGKTEFREDDAGYVEILSPRSCYPLSKRCAENLCISYARQYDLEAVIARPCHTYSPVYAANDNRANVQFISSAAKGEDIILKSRGTQVRSYSYIADTVSGLLTVMSLGRDGEAYNLANKKGTISIAGFAEEAARAGGVSVAYQLSGNNQPSPFTRAVLNGDKLQSLGWKAAFSLKDGIGHSVEILKWKYNLIE